MCTQVFCKPNEYKTNTRMYSGIRENSEMRRRANKKNKKLDLLMQNLK